MSDPIKRLGLAPVQRACMRGMEAINLTSSTYLHGCADMDLGTFCHWASQVLKHGLHFVGGTYASEGVTPRLRWAFWAPVRSPSGQDHESIFVARYREGYWHFGLFFYGDDEPLHARLANCVLHGEIRAAGDQRVLGRPQRIEDDGVAVTSFEISVPADHLGFVSLLTAAQFKT